MRSRSRGFTLIETAISGVVIAGITAGLLLAMRYAQMVNQGKAVGQQLATISEGAGRYMKQYSKNILALDARCAEPTLQISGGPVMPPDPSDTVPDCKLVLGDVTVVNGYQPTVEELRRLELVRANDQLMLPFSPGIAVDKRTGEAALARVAVWIRPVRHTGAGNGNGNGNGNGTTAALLNTRQDVSGVSSVPSSFSAAGTFGVQPGTRPALDMPPSMNGVSCYNGRFSNSHTVVDATRVFANVQNPRKVYRSDTQDTYDAAVALTHQGIATMFFGGESYCRFMQENYGEGIFGGSVGTPPDGGPGGGTGGTSGDAWTLESVVFNTQPYYYGAATLPIGAAAQVGAALEQAGYAGRLSMLKSSLADSRQIRGLYGHSVSENPIQSKDRSKGLPGILAAVTLLADSESASGGTGGGTGGTGSMPTWDAGGNNLYNASLLQGQQIAGETAVVGSGVSALPTKGREAVMAVNGNMVMGHNTVIMANNLEANQIQTNQVTSNGVSAQNVQVTGPLLKLGHLGADAKFNFYMRNGTNVRLPRVDPGSLCDPNTDMASSRALMILNQYNTVVAMTRFLLFCKPDRATNTNLLEFGTSNWSSPEYEAMKVQYPIATHRWHYFDSAPTDSSNPTWEPR